MSVTQRVIAQPEGLQQIESLGSLRQLAELVSDPQKIISAHETARHQMQLTEAEALKIQQARDFLADYDAKVSALESRRIAVEQAEEAHRKIVAQHEADEIQRNEHHESIRIAQSEKDRAIDEKIKRHEEDKRLFNADKESAETDISDRKAECSKREADCTRREEANEREGDRLSGVRASLARQAKALKEATRSVIDGAIEG